MGHCHALLLLMMLMSLLQRPREELSLAGQLLM